jgi:hypothetical protein
VVQVITAIALLNNATNTTAGVATIPTTATNAKSTTSITTVMLMYAKENGKKTLGFTEHLQQLPPFV